MRRTLLSVGVLLVGHAASGQTAPVLDPTQFQSAPASNSPAQAIGLKASVGVEVFDRRPSLIGTAAAPYAPEQALRSVLDYRREWRLGEQARLTLSDRLEWLQDDSGHATVRNALREAYVSVGLGEDWFADVGRINVRSGVGLGFNPSDWLREGANLPQTTQNPASQRENRLGTVMLKLQTVQTWGAAHLALVPHLAARPQEASPYGLDFGRTNADTAIHVRLAPQVNERLSIDLLAYARKGRHPQWGLNSTAVLGDAWIAHLEWATGARQLRVAAGMSWTSSSGAVLAIERHLDTAATHRDAWFARLALSGLLRDPDIDLSGFVRLNPHDHSRLWQVDGSWHASAQVSVHASVGGFAGAARSEFGANPLRSFVALRAEVAY